MKMTMKELKLRNKIYDLERALAGAKEDLAVWQENQKPNPDWDWLKNGDFNLDEVIWGHLILIFEEG